MKCFAGDGIDKTPMYGVLISHPIIERNGGCDVNAGVARCRSGLGIQSVARGSRRSLMASCYVDVIMLGAELYSSRPPRRFRLWQLRESKVVIEVRHLGWRHNYLNQTSTDVDCKRVCRHKAR